jgi:hypothetical protein
MSVTCSKLVKCNEDEITKSSWDPDSQERDLMRGVMARAEIGYSLKVIRTHLSIPAISMQTFETSGRSFLTGVEKFPRTFAVEPNISPDPFATRSTYQGEMLQENLNYLWNFSLVFESHGVSSGASFDDMAGIRKGCRAV